MELKGYSSIQGNYFSEAVRNAAQCVRLVTICNEHYQQITEYINKYFQELDGVPKSISDSFFLSDQMAATKKTLKKYYEKINEDLIAAQEGIEKIDKEFVEFCDNFLTEHKKFLDGINPNNIADTQPPKYLSEAAKKEWQELQEEFGQKKDTETNKLLLRSLIARIKLNTESVIKKSKKDFLESMKKDKNDIIKGLDSIKINLRGLATKKLAHGKKTEEKLQNGLEQPKNVDVLKQHLNPDIDLERARLMQIKEKVSGEVYLTAKKSAAYGRDVLLNILEFLKNLWVLKLIKFEPAMQSRKTILDAKVIAEVNKYKDEVTKEIEGVLEKLENVDGWSFEDRETARRKALMMNVSQLFSS